MITIESAESALKNIYIDVIRNDLNMRSNPFLAKIHGNTRTVASKDAHATIRYGQNDSVGARGEDSDLPFASTNKYAEVVLPLKNLYGTFQITDKAIKASQNSPGAFASLLSGEMHNLISSAQDEMNRMIFGNGEPVFATSIEFDYDTEEFVFSAKDFAKMKVGDIFDVHTPQKYLGRVTVSALNASKSRVSVTGDYAMPKNDRSFFRRAPRSNMELNGIDSIFTAETIYNLNREEYPEILPYIHYGPGPAPSPFSEDQFVQFMCGYENHCGSEPADVFLAHPIVRRSLFESMKALRTNIETVEISGGFKGVSLNGIPLFSDMKCTPGSLYALTSDNWAIHQLCDWSWLSGDDGSVLRRIENKPAYSATIVKYAELLCDNPAFQGKASEYLSGQYKYI